MTARLLVTGSRSWEDVDTIYATLYAAWENLGRDVLLVHGDCPTGADALASQVWWTAGHPQEPHPADWTTYGKEAGFRRNTEMVALGADAALAFDMQCASPKCTRKDPHITHGTQHCINLIQYAGIPLWRWSLSPH